MAVGHIRTIYHHAETTIDHLAPAYAAAVVDAHPGGSSEGIADNVLYGHVGAELRPVVDVAGFTERRVGARHVVVVASEYHGCFQLTLADGLVEGEGYLGASFGVGIEDAGL